MQHVFKFFTFLKDEALTAKQVATKLNKSAGSVHYHVQILYDGGLLELVDTKEKRGIIEKYYKKQKQLISILKKAAQKERIQIVILYLIYF